MPNTMNLACPLCSLGFGGKPLLGLHIREGHRQRVLSTQDGPGDPDSTRAAAPWADSQSHEQDLMSRQPWTSKVAAAPTTRPRPRTGRPMSILWGAFRALRNVNGERLRTAEAIIRRAFALQPRPQAPMPRGGKPGKAQRRTPTERADHEDCLICRAGVSI